MKKLIEDARKEHKEGRSEVFPKEESRWKSFTEEELEQVFKSFWKHRDVALIDICDASLRDAMMEEIQAELDSRQEEAE